MKANNIFQIDEIEYEVALAQKGFSLSDVFYLQDVKDRTFWFTDGIDATSVSDVIRQIYRINKEDKGIFVSDRKPIRLFINTHGGDVDAGFALIDAIENSITPVYTINHGCACNMGFLVMLAGDKRYATKNAMFLLNGGTNLVWNDESKVQDCMEFQKALEWRIRNYVLARSRYSEDDYDKKQWVELYLFANEAKKYGFIDLVVGEDCSLSVLL